MAVRLIRQHARLPRRAAVAVAAIVLAVPGGALAQQHERVDVGAFSIDAAEVTVGQFTEFAAATKLTTEAERKGGSFEYGAGWEMRDGWTFRRPFGIEPLSADEPAVHVTWAEADSYCKWRGGRLPGAGEWALAAYSEQRSSAPEDFEQGRSYAYPVGDTPEGMNLRGDDPWPRHVPAGTTAAGVNGLFDMGGNVWEWLADRQGDEALTAGGSWWYGAEQTTKDGMQWKPAGFHAVYVGFRCAYDGPA